MSQPNNKNNCDFIKRLSLKPRVINRARTNCYICEYNSNGENKCNFTSDDLDMRRKAEVLQYKKNSNVTDNMSKAQKYALIARGKGQHKKTYASQTQTYTNHNSFGATEISNVIKLPSCLNTIKTSTHASDVPGTEMQLYMDKYVPLTNYIVRRTYSGNHSDPVPAPHYHHYHHDHDPAVAPHPAHHHHHPVCIGPSIHMKIKEGNNYIELTSLYFVTNKTPSQTSFSAVILVCNPDPSIPFAMYSIDADTPGFPNPHTKLISINRHSANSNYYDITYEITPNPARPTYAFPVVGNTPADTLTFPSTSGFVKLTFD